MGEPDINTVIKLRTRVVLQFRVEFRFRFQMLLSFFYSLVRVFYSKECQIYSNITTSDTFQILFLTFIHRIWNVTTKASDDIWQNFWQIENFCSMLLGDTWVCTLGLILYLDKVIAVERYKWFKDDFFTMCSCTEISIATFFYPFYVHSINLKPFTLNNH